MTQPPRQYPRDPGDPGISIGTLIHEAAGRWPTNAAVIDPDTGCSLDYTQLAARARAAAGWLGELGLGEDSKVVVAAGNSIAAVEILCGCMYGGIIPVPCNPGLGPEQLAFVLEHCDGEVVLACRENLPPLDDVLRRCRQHADLIEIGRSLQLPESDLLPATRCADNEALIIYTSGTTGAPKGVLHSGGGMLAAIENTAVTYGLSSDDRFLCVLPVHHANSIHKIFATWLTGGTVVLPARFEVRSFWRWVDEQKCTWLALVPSIISQLLKITGAGRHPSVRFARSSSAPLPGSWHREFQKKFNMPLLEGMGSTEAGPLFSSPLPPQSRKIGSPGKCVIGQEVRIVDNEDDELRDNEVGSIVVRGPSRMKGYYNDPQATAAALTPDGWFRTGDIGYRDPEGFFFVTGRAKEIVIKAGVNIALPEIDEVLACHPDIADAASTGVEDPNLGEEIAAFVVVKPGSEISEPDLLDFCVDQLGAFKAPATILKVPEIPRLPNGKVQRYLLRKRIEPQAVVETVPLPRPATGDRFVAPRTPVEIIMAGTWCEHLGQPSIGVHDDFFAMGGYSLLAISMLTPLRRQLGTSLSLSAFFDHPNIAGQAIIATAQRLRRLSAPERRSLLSLHAGHSTAWDREDPQAGCDYDGVQALTVEERCALEAALLQLPADRLQEDRILPRASTGACVLSFAQERIWFMGQMSSESALYNTGSAVRLRGPLDVDALERAINTLVQRHEVLRCSITVVDGQPWQRFREQLRITVTRKSLALLCEPEQRAALNRTVLSEIRRPYALDDDPLIRATTLELGRNHHVFILCCHHIVYDGLSLRILLQELGILYGDEVQRRKSELPSLPIQYGDFATWQRNRLDGARKKRETDYWLRRLDGVPLVLDLPTDHPRPAVLSYRGKRSGFMLGDRLSTSVYDISRTRQVSPFTTLCAAFAALLYRYSAQRDFVIGLPFADRDRPELQYLVGLLLDTHVIRFSLSDGIPFQEVIVQTRSEVAESYAHRELPFELVVDAMQPERELGRTPLCQVLVNWREPETRLPSVALKGTSTQLLLSHDGTSKFDLTMTFSKTDSGIEFEIEFSTDLYEAATIERMAGHYRRLLEAALKDPACPIGELPLLTRSERRQILFEWNGASIVYPGAGTLHELFEEQVARSPAATAIVYGGTQLTYRQLNERANQLARLLQSRGVGPEILVGVLMERSPEMVIGLIAALKAGGAYLPLDPEYPAERLAFMVAETGAAVILTQKHLRDRVPPVAKCVFVVDEAWPEAAHLPTSNTISGVSRDNAAYVIYTSGSTGRPKGVVNTHAGIVNRIQWMQERFVLDASDRVMQKTPFSFDVSVWEFFWPLLAGAQLVLAEPGGHRDADYLVREIARQGITTVHFVPSMLRLFLEHPGVHSCAGLKRVICSGEALSHDLQMRFFSLFDAELHNLYGPTEAAVEVTAWQCLPDNALKIVPIGCPIANTRIRIVDAGLRAVPVGVPGELLIGGVQVARGYMSRPELTSDRFIKDPFNSGGRLYRTGDMARWLPDGNIEFLGRLDMQVKLRGYRIELGEIEVVLTRHEQVRACAAVLHEGVPGDQRIIAYVIATEGRKTIDQAALRAHLKSTLPDYMIPAIFTPLEAFPLTASGKLDRRALPAPDPGARAPEDSPVVAPHTPVEQLLAEIWGELLGLEQIGVHDNFFGLGGHSLLAIRVMNRMNDVLGVEMTLVQLFETPTLAKLARAVERARDDFQQ